VKPPTGRGERTVLSCGNGSFTLIDESYNANPASMRAALATLAAFDLPRGGRRLAVLGDMKELGQDGAQLHRDLAPAVEESGADRLFAAGPLMEHLVKALPSGLVAAHAATSAELIDQVCAAVRPGDAIMVKGSLSMGMGQVVKALKSRFGAAGAQALKG
jgi:UDP-N-acetylmuramoyl-tripeptide--D-alanyl-D-alanine ligase